jgi:hypothetical protein
MSVTTMRKTGKRTLPIGGACEVFGDWIGLVIGSVLSDISPWCTGIVIVPQGDATQPQGRDAANWSEAAVAQLLKVTAAVSVLRSCGVHVRRIPLQPADV